jgi:GTP-binding protein
VPWFGYGPKYWLAGGPAEGGPTAGEATAGGNVKQNSEKPAKSAGSSGPRVSSAEFAAGAAESSQVPPPADFSDAPEIAFAGRSNVGKSSLLNMMLQRRGLARTSNTPGCTRQINFFDVRLAGDEPKHVVFVDLPGYGYAKVSKSEAGKWKGLLESYLLERPTLRAVVVLVDVRRGLEAEEEDLIEFLEERPELRVIVAATKVDKLSLSAQKPAVAKLAAGKPFRVVATSGESGAGREELWGRILGACRPA